jgi:hypothetical protein
VGSFNLRSNTDRIRLLSRNLASVMNQNNDYRFGHSELVFGVLIRHAQMMVIPFVWVVCFFLTTGAFAEPTVILKSKDGQILKGVLIDRGKGVIKIHSEVFGHVQVEESKVKVLDWPEEQPDPRGEEKGSLPVPPLTAPVSIDEDTQKEKTRKWLGLPKDLNGQIGVGLGFIEGHQTKWENYSTSLQLGYDHERYHNQIRGDYLYNRVNDHLVSNNYNLIGETYRYFGRPKIGPYYARLLVMHSQDEVQLVDRQSEIFSGLGKDIYKSASATFRVDAGYVSEWEDFSHNPAFAFSDPGVEHRHKIYLHEQVDFQLNSKFQIQHDGLFMMESSDQFEIRLKTMLKYKLSDHFSLNLNHSFIFDDTSPVGVDEELSQTNLQLSYNL